VNGRTRVTLVLVDADGNALGALPPFPVTEPHWPEAAPVVDGARERHGIDITVLRLLTVQGEAGTVDGEAGTGDGEAVTYVAEVAGKVPSGLSPVDGVPADAACRAPWARAGGPAASLAWAREVLGPDAAPVRAQQVKTWNLSSVWRLSHARGTAWLKEVPGFFGHEGRILGWLADHLPGLAPVPLAVDGARMLLADIPGEDRWGAPATERLSMLAALHRIQLTALDALPRLRRLGVPVRDLAGLPDRVAPVARRYGYPTVLSGLDARLAELAACGVPETLVHADFHPGNVRGSVILDWGDCIISHPGFDLLRMTGDLSTVEAEKLAAAWCGWWREAVPGCRPERALELLPPIAALNAATTYARFLDHIEESEYVYHCDDPPFWLDRAAALLHASR
jgi:hypothetical protein